MPWMKQGNQYRVYGKAPIKASTRPTMRQTPRQSTQMSGIVSALTQKLNQFEAQIAVLREAVYKNSTVTCAKCSDDAKTVILEQDMKSPKAEECICTEE